MNTLLHRMVRLTTLFVLGAFLYACDGDDGAPGATGATGPAGPAGPAGPPAPVVSSAIQIGDGSALTTEEIEELGKLTATITNVTVASPPVVEFTVVDQHGNPAEGIESGFVWFTFAKLVPNTDPDVNGGLPYWQSYINTVESTDAGTDAIKPDVLSQAVHATTDSRFSGGSHVETAPGVYTYTFGTDVTAVTSPIAVAWEPNLTHRVGLEIRLDGPGEVPLAPDNPVYDFVPDGSSGSGVAREIAATENCGNCHYELAIHGGPRKSVEYCVTCHNQGTVDQDSGESMDMAYLAHSIHMGEDRTDAGYPFVVYGFGERFGRANDFSEVTYPQSVAYCETCHVASESHPQGNAWNEAATAKSCGGCHADGLVAENFDATTGQAEYSFDHAVSDVTAIDVQPDGSCGGCHLGTIPTAGTALSIHSRLDGDQRFRDELGDDFVFEIISATNIGPGETPVITFRVTDAAGTPYDILTAPEFDVANRSSMNLYTAWPGIENYNGEEGGATGGFRLRMDSETGMPGTPSYYGAGHPNRMYLDVIQYYIENAVGASADNGDGTYTVEYFTALPTDFTGQAMIAMGGHPAAVDVEDADGVVGNQRAAASSVVWFPEGAERDYAFDSDSCNACHKDLQFHGANRNTNVEICVVCHNADLASDDSFHLGSMVHAIHSASPSFVDGEFAGVTYPQPIANCDTCHIEGKYNTAREEARSVSLTSGLDETVWTDDIATTPTSNACGSCHTSVAAMGHFNTQGGQVMVSKDMVLQVGGVPNGQEACSVCHGPGNEFDTTKYHNPGLEE